MNIKNNQRTNNTQNKIKGIFIELLGGRNISQITVRDICRKANINRSTFYAHYNDIYDLMQKIVMEKEQGINTLLTEPEDGINKLFSEKKLEKLFDFIYQNADFYRIYLNDFNSSKTIDHSINASWKQNIEPILSVDTKKSEAELLYQFEYYKSGMLGVLRKWLNINCKESPAEMILFFKNCIHLNNL